MDTCCCTATGCSWIDAESDKLATDVAMESCCCIWFRNGRVTAEYDKSAEEVAEDSCCAYRPGGVDPHFHERGVEKAATQQDGHSLRNASEEMKNH